MKSALAEPAAAVTPSTAETAETSASSKPIVESRRRSYRAVSFMYSVAVAVITGRVIRRPVRNATPSMMMSRIAR